MLRWCGLLGALLLCATPLCASFSGLRLIPTASVMPPGEVCGDYQTDGRDRLGSPVDAAFLNTQFGVGSRAEVGLDLDFGEDPPTGVLLNWKLGVVPMETGLGVAVGSFNLGERLAPTSYTVATLYRAPFRFDGGVQVAPAETQGLSGVERELNDRLQLWLERVTGNEGASAASLAYQLSERWGVSFGWIRPNEEEADDSYSLHMGCALPGA